MNRVFYCVEAGLLSPAKTYFTNLPTPLTQIYRRNSNAFSAGLLCLLLALPFQNSSATGFFINQQSVTGMGRVDAGNAAVASDPSTIFFNPAGLTHLWANNSGADYLSSFGTNVIIPRSDVTDRSSTAATPATLGFALPLSGSNGEDPGQPTPVPNLYITRRFTDSQWIAGFGITAPFGLTSEYDPGWFGRYDSIESELVTINLGPVFAYKVSDRLSIGGGIDLQYAKSKLVSALPNTLVPGGPTAATDGRLKLNGNDWSAGFNIGALFDFGTGTRIGAHYRSEMKHEIEGRVVSSGLAGPLAPLNAQFVARADLNLPDIATLGVVHELTPALDFLAEVAWYGWSDFDEVRARLEGGAPDIVRPASYRDTYAASVGAEYKYSEKITLRGGLKYDRTPTVDTTRDTTFPDADRIWIGAGATVRHSKKITVDVAIVHAFFDDTSIDITRTIYAGSPVAGTIRILGDIESSVTTVSANMRYRF